MTAILLTVAPATTSLPVLLRIAIDAQQVGAARLHLPTDLDDPVGVVAALRERTTLVLTTDPAGSAIEFCDFPGPAFTEVIIGGSDPDGVIPDAAAAVEEVARLAREASAKALTVSVAGRGGAATAVLLSAVAAGLHVRVGTADAPRIPVDRRGGGSDIDPNTAQADIALIARAAGVARIGGRPPVDARTAREMLGIPTNEGEAV
jgi:hypothetical protein